MGVDQGAQVTAFDDIAHVIQLAIAPVFLLTAIAGFVNALLSRLSRAIDRRRSLEDLLPAYEEGSQARAHMTYELELLARRIHLIMWAVGLSVLSAVFICLLIGLAFLAAFVSTQVSGALAGLFVLSILSLTACLLLFFREVLLAGRSVQHNIRTRRGA
jgi:hypothetical protein